MSVDMVRVQLYYSREFPGAVCQLPFERGEQYDIEPLEGLDSVSNNALDGLRRVLHHGLYLPDIGEETVKPASREELFRWASSDSRRYVASLGEVARCAGLHIVSQYPLSGDRFPVRTVGFSPEGKVYVIAAGKNSSLFAASGV
ncbi:hypothetical protein KA093_01850 [Candidatus Saccharibacteria bacterium]|nr:hypothetical protein [Candidatus Saccharibacteria bacterium]